MLLHKEFDSIVVCTKCHSLQKQSDMPSIAAGTFHITSDKIIEKFLQNFQIYSFVIVNVNLEKKELLYFVLFSAHCGSAQWNIISWIC